MTTTAQYEGIIKEMTSTYDTIIAELKILDKRAFDAEETVKTLRDRLEERNDEIAQLKEEISELATCPASCQDLRKRDMEIHGLKAQLETANNVIHRMEKDNEFHHQRHVARKKYVNDLEGENKQLRIKLQKIRELADVEAV